MSQQYQHSLTEVCTQIRPKEDDNCPRGHDGDKIAGPQVEEDMAGETPLCFLRKDVATQRGCEDHVQSCTVF